jgi:16S rRNA (uracil1498-N3)-methyltransferase
MRCFYCKKISIGEAELDNSELAHIFNVLKLKAGEEILLNDCHGTLATAKITNSKKVIPIEVKKIPEPKTKIFLFVSPPRKQQLDKIITQCCEVGVWSINLIKTEYSVSIPAEKDEKIERWQTRIIEACKQSHNPYAPEIFPPITFNEALKKVKNKNLTAFFGTTSLEHPTSLADAMRQHPGRSGTGQGEQANIPGRLQATTARAGQHSTSNRVNVAWFVGPEGGFSPKEQSAMIENNFTPLTLGNWIMRVETATVVGAALLQKLG